MSQPNQELSLEQYVVALRNQIIISYDQAKELALKNYDDISKRFAEAHNALQIQAKAEADKKGIVKNEKVPEAIKPKKATKTRK